MPLKQTMPLSTTRPRTRPALVFATGSAASGNANAACGINASAPIAAPPCNTLRRSIFMPSRSILFWSNRNRLIMLKHNRYRMIVVVVPNRTIANRIGAWLDNLPKRHHRLVLTHAGNNFVLVDMRPDIRAPMLVRDVRIVVEKNLVGGQGIKAALVIADRHSILRFWVGGLRHRKCQQYMPLPRWNAQQHRSLRRRYLLEHILNDQRLRAHQRAHRMRVIRMMVSVVEVVHLVGSADPDRLSDQLSLVLQRVGPLLLQVHRHRVVIGHVGRTVCRLGRRRFLVVRS